MRRAGDGVCEEQICTSAIFSSNEKALIKKNVINYHDDKEQSVILTNEGKVYR